MDVNYVVQVPATVKVVSPSAVAQLEKRREARMQELEREGWRPSSNWLLQRPLAAGRALLRRQAL